MPFIEMLKSKSANGILHSQYKSYCSRKIFLDRKMFMIYCLVKSIGFHSNVHRMIAFKKKCVYIHIHTYAICVYVYIHIYTHIHTYVLTWTHIYLSDEMIKWSSLDSGIVSFLFLVLFCISVFCIMHVLLL